MCFRPLSPLRTKPTVVEKIELLKSEINILQLVHVDNSNKSKNIPKAEIENLS